MFYEHIPTEAIVFFILYGGTALAAVIACIYLCVRRGNAFAPDITPPMTLRRWAAAYYATAFMSHGTNRLYLSHYFSRKGITYNAYINDLRINHFMHLYREAAQTGQPIIAQQLAKESGYRSYSTFSLAFKQRIGLSVSAWMHETTE
jgi:hypothetical protein